MKNLHSLLRFAGALLIALLFASGLCWPTAQAEDPLTVRFTGIMIRSMSVRASESRTAEVLDTVQPNEHIEIYDFTPEWLYINSKAGPGYVLRNQVRDIVPVDPSTTLPYGAIRHLYVARIAENTALYMDKDTNGDAHCALTKGSYVSMWYIADGWAVIPYWRKIGYVPMDMLEDLTPVSPTVAYAQSGDLLAAFTSFYETKETESNLGRMENIRVSCAFISNVMAPEEEFSFNGIAGPYQRTRGYKPAPVLYEGTTTIGYGGGTCQVSTTLYNVLLQLPEGIGILYRRPHGPTGARYVPHGTDAAVGADSLDLRFKNTFPFAVRIFAYAQNGALFISIYKQ